MNTKLKAFSQLGFVLQKEQKTQLRGKCPFCQDDNHFYINIENLKWDCKKCNRSGGFKSFMEQIIIFGIENLKGSFIIALANDRGFTIKTIRKHRIGYLPSKKIYILPTGEYLQIYRIGGKLINLTGCGTELFHAEQLFDKKGKVWLCEGAWDAIACEEMLDNKKDVCVSVPGATILKGEWITFFQDRNVNCLYDKGSAGDIGCLKVYNCIKASARSLNFIHWEESKRDKYDIRDYYISGNKIENVRKLLQDVPRNIEDQAIIEVDDLLDGKGLIYTDVYKAFSKRKGGWLYMENEEPLDVMFGTIIANRLEGDPIWLFLIAPPGGLKTELVRTLSDSPKIHTESKLTPHSLISGYRAGGGDPSLVLKLNGKVLIVKDWTTMLSMFHQTLEEVYSTLRDIFDGECKASYGNGAIGVYKSTFGIIGCVTPAIENHAVTQASLGARFLQYCIPLDTSIMGTRRYIKAAVNNEGKEIKMREELRKISNDVLNYNFTDIPEVTKEIRNKLISLTQLLSVMRGTVIRDTYSKEITQIPFNEIGTRPSKSLLKLMRGIAMFRGETEIQENVYNIIKKVAIDSMPLIMSKILSSMYLHKKKKLTTQEVKKILNLPRITCLRNLENLFMLGVFKKESIGIGSGKVVWILNKDIKEIIEESEVYK